MDTIDMGDDARANRLYPSTANQASDAPRRENAQGGAANRLYPTTAERDDQPAPGSTQRSTSTAPPHIAEMREQDLSRRMFAAGETYKSDLPDELMQEAGLDAGEAREVLADLGADATDAQALRSLVKTDADEATRASWLEESQAVIKQQNFTQRDLDGARVLAQRDPRVAAYLDATGLGNHPRVIARFVELARSQVAAGRLRIK